MEGMELFIKELEFISLLEGSVEHVHGHVEIKSLIELFLLIILSIFNLVTREISLALLIIIVVVLES